MMSCGLCQAKNRILRLTKLAVYTGGQVWNRNYSAEKCPICGLFKCEGCNLYGVAREVIDPFRAAICAQGTDCTCRLCPTCVVAREEEFEEADS